MRFPDFACGAFFAGALYFFFSVAIAAEGNGCDRKCLEKQGSEWSFETTTGVQVW